MIYVDTSVVVALLTRETATAAVTAWLKMRQFLEFRENVLNELLDMSSNAIFSY